MSTVTPSNWVAQAKKDPWDFQLSRNFLGWTLRLLGLGNEVSLCISEQDAGEILSAFDKAEAEYLANSKARLPIIITTAKAQWTEVSQKQIDGRLNRKEVGCEA